MGFLQIIDFHTDRYDEFMELEKKWEVDSAGVRTSTGGRLYADRDNPGHYVALDWFTDYDSIGRITTSGTVSIVTDTGRRYPIASRDLLGKLCFAGVTPVQVPAQLIALLGVTLRL